MNPPGSWNTEMGQSSNGMYGPPMMGPGMMGPGMMGPGMMGPGIMGQNNSTLENTGSTNYHFYYQCWPQCLGLRKPYLCIGE